MSDFRSHQSSDVVEGEGPETNGTRAEASSFSYAYV